MTDPFSNSADRVSAPARRAVAVVPNDTQALDDVPKAIFVGSGGSVAMRGVDDSADTVWRNVADGTVLPFRPAYIRTTGTTAGDILALI